MIRSEKEFYCKWRPHPWHGLDVGADPPTVLNAYIEITPSDPVKYEIDKNSGYLMVDRPQLGSSLPPMSYGFVPKTYCGKKVADLSEYTDEGDEDPLDICVVSERPVSKSEVILTAKVVGVIRTLDEKKADDKILSVLKDDAFWGDIEDISQLPEMMVHRLRHYFYSYKNISPGDKKVSVKGVGNAEEAFEIIKAAMQDYQDRFEMFQDKS